MQKIVGLSLSILFLLACTDQKPKNLLPQPDMTDLLYELALVGGMLGGVFNTLGMQLRDTLGDFLFGIPGWIYN